MADAFAKVYPHPIPFMFEGFQRQELNATERTSATSLAVCAPDLVNYNGSTLRPVKSGTDVCPALP